MPINSRITDWPATMAAFSARLRETREVRGMLPKELARLVGVAPGTIWNWENHYCYPKRASIARLAEVLGVSEQFLETGQGDPNGPNPSDTDLDDDQAEPFSSMIEDFRLKVALKTGMPPSSVRVSVEFLST